MILWQSISDFYRNSAVLVQVSEFLLSRLKIQRITFLNMFCYLGFRAEIVYKHLETHQSDDIEDHSS